MVQIHLKKIFAKVLSFIIKKALYKVIHLIFLLILKNTMLTIFKNTKYTKAAGFNNLSRRFLTFQMPI